MVSGDGDFHASGARLLLSLAKFGLTGIKAEHDQMLVTRAAALRNHNVNSQS